MFSFISIWRLVLSTLLPFDPVQHLISKGFGSPAPAAPQGSADQRRCLWPRPIHPEADPPAAKRNDFSLWLKITILGRFSTKHT
jgi:hypothetical protein